MARKRELELEALRLRLQLDHAMDDLERIRAERNNFAEKANTLEWTLRAANDQARDLQQQAQALQTKNAVLMERLELLAAGIGDTSPPAQGLPLPTSHEPEEVEDARYALAMGNINHSEFNKILDEYGFTNTEVQFDGAPGDSQF